MSGGVVIVGCGEAGARAAVGLSDGGFKGSVTIVGAERHAPYERPPLSKAAIIAAGEPQPPWIADAQNLAARGVLVALGVEVVSLDRARKRLALSDGRELAYETLVLATGARARTLSLEGTEHVRTLRRYEDALALRPVFHSRGAIVVIGGGLIGLELAASANWLGAEVTVLEAAPRILTRGVPEALARRLERKHAEAGVRILSGVRIAAVSRRAERTIVALADGREFAADVVVAGIGAAPETSLAARAGLAVDNGVIADARLRTSDPDVSAIGDCANFAHALFGGRRVRLEAWRNAFDQGAYIARRTLGADEDFRAVPWFWSDQYDVTLQVAGFPDLGVEAVNRRLGGDASLTFHLDATGRLVGASALGALSAIARDMRIAEMLIAAEATPSPKLVADPATKLKALLRQGGV